MFPLSDKFSLFFGILLCGQVCLVHAEKADHDKPLNIEADRMSLDNANHVSIFDGKVELTQGTLRVVAEKIVVTEDATGHKYCVATGHLASFRQKRDGANEYVEGYGERIEYNTLIQKIDLYVRARVKRDQDDVRGDHITYSTQTEIFRVSSPENTGRVRATLQPKNKDSQNPEPSASDAKESIPVQPESKTLEPALAPKSSEPAAAATKATESRLTEPKTSGPVAESGATAPKNAIPVSVQPTSAQPISSQPVTSEPLPAGK
jgi:lipopolysaccharide export system protein LptA